LLLFNAFVEKEFYHTVCEGTVTRYGHVNNMRSRKNAYFFLQMRNLLFFVCTEYVFPFSLSLLIFFGEQFWIHCFRLVQLLELRILYFCYCLSSSQRKMSDPYGSQHDDEDDGIDVNMDDLYPDNEGSELVDEDNQLNPQAVESTKIPVEVQALEFSAKLKYTSPISAIAVHAPLGSNTPPMVITGSEDKKVVVWDMRSGKKMLLLENGHTAGITSIAVYAPKVGSDTTVKVITASEDGTAVIWKLLTGERILTLRGEHQGGIHAVAVFTPAEKNTDALIVTAGEDGQAIVWDMKKGIKVRTLVGGHHDRAGLNAVAVYAPPADEGVPVVVTGGDDSMVVVWNLITGKMLRVLEGHTNVVTSLAVCPPFNGGVSTPATIISGGLDETAIVWDLNTGEKLRLLEGEHTDTVSAIAVCVPRDDSLPLVITASEDKTAVIWDVASGAVLRKLEGVHTDYLNAVAVLIPNDESAPPVIITGSDDRTAVFWELTHGAFFFVCLFVFVFTVLRIRMLLFCVLFVFIMSQCSAFAFVAFFFFFLFLFLFLFCFFCFLPYLTSNSLSPPRWGCVMLLSM
jgi:WD40 repeat protein